MIDYSRKIVITGGPGGGKTTALDLFQREFESRVKVVPESATILFQAGVEREDSPERIKILQESIYQTQKAFEESYQRLNSGRLLLCDRGSLDGLAYWPGTEEEFFKQINSTIEEEIARYKAVIFFESGASKSTDMQSNNPFRHESNSQAVALDKKLQEVWKKHPHFYFVPNSSSFMKKISDGVNTISDVLKEFGS